MTNILNSNGYNRGFEDGKTAAMSGKDNNYIRLRLEVKYEIHFISL